jgi:acyl-CoA synthetase (AMP-forming)/AMP-acid ligase II
MDLAHLFFRSAQRNPERPLWISADRDVVSYAEGAERVAAFANAVLEREAPGSRVATLTTNRYEGFEAYLGAITAGCGVVTMNPRGHVDDYRYMIDDSEAAIVVCDIDLVERLEPLRGSLASVRHWVCFGGNADGYEPFEEWIASASSERPDVLIDPDAPAWLFYTSGTTGKPKGAIESHRNLLAMTQHFLLELGGDIAPTDVMLHLAPISHGSTSVGLPHLAVGAANAFPASLSFDPERVFETIERLKVTTTMLAPTMLHVLLESPAIERYDLTSLKTVCYGAAPMPISDLKRALEIFGPIFIQFYGQAEAAATITCLPKAEHRLDGDEKTLTRLGSAGRETFSSRVRILDPNGQVLAPGETGEIAVRGALVMPGYWRRPEATAAAIPDGWLRTGDAGYLDEDGYLFITDRVKDMIISGGSNVYAREVENVLVTHPDISEVAVIGLPDPKWGEIVAAVVVARDPDLAEADVIEFAREKMAGYKKPQRVWFVEALPTNANGKILKRVLRDRFSAEVGAPS